MSKTVQYDQIKGLRNDVSPERFDPQDMAVAQNVDLDETGKLYRRLGTKRRIAGDMHSLFGFGDMAYVVSNGVLNALSQDMLLTPITAVAVNRVSYTGINEKVYWSNNVVSGELKGAGNVPWGIAVPPPITATTIPGAMRAGRYMMSITYVRSDGRESGAPRSTEIALGDNLGLQFSNLPVSSDPLVTTKRIYITGCNGDLPYLTATLTNSTKTASVTELPAQGMALRTQFMGPAPVGQVVGYFAGRAYVASGPYLWYSLPHEYDLFDLRTGFVAFDANVQTFAAVSDGIYIGTERATYWLEGKDPTQFVRTQVAAVGTVLGTEVHLRNDLVGKQEEGTPGKVVGWMSKKGFFMGFDGGLATNKTGGRYYPPVGSEGASLFKIRGGTPQVVTTIFS